MEAKTGGRTGKISAERCRSASGYVTQVLPGEMEESQDAIEPPQSGNALPPPQVIALAMWMMEVFPAETVQRFIASFRQIQEDTGWGTVTLWVTPKGVGRISYEVSWQRGNAKKDAMFE